MSNTEIAIIAGFVLASLVGLGMYALCVLFDRCIDTIWPPTPESVAQAEAEKLQREADKQIKRRIRLAGGLFKGLVK